MNLSHLVLIAPRHSLPIITGLLVTAILPMPSGYYILMRIMLFGILLVLTLRAKRERNMRGIFWLMLFLTVLFNPILTIGLPRPVWIPIDIILASMCWWVHSRYGHVSRA